MNDITRADDHKKSDIFYLILIKPTHYDDDGYPIQWFKSFLSSNSLATLNGLGIDLKERKILGENVDIRILLIDESQEIVKVSKIVQRIAKDRAKALVALVGVQTNQFPRAVDLGRQFIENNVPVCLGGFHVSGILSMEPGIPVEIKEAQDKGISIFVGEAEQHRLEVVVQDAYNGELKSLYDYLFELPDIAGEPVPVMPSSHIAKTNSHYAPFDLGRGCPFKCSFCTIINVQGHKSRFRTADDLEKIVRKNTLAGMDRLFITDDNLARNKNWESFFDRLIYLQSEGIRVRILAQVDTQSHKIENFIEKATQAGVDQIFIGIESINPENLASIGKSQNKISEYKKMLLDWKKYPVVITAGYIIGMPNDTKETICQDIETIKKELPIDQLYFTYLTPLPGSEDHQRMAKNKEWMDPDLNKYDLTHPVTHHSKMSSDEWEEAFLAAWKCFYTFAHKTTVLRRMVALGSNKYLTTLHRLIWYGNYQKRGEIHPFEKGFWRVKSRVDRRPSLPRENPLVFYPRYWFGTLRDTVVVFRDYWMLHRVLKKIRKDPKRMEYTDEAIRP